MDICISEKIEICREIRRRKIKILLSLLVKLHFFFKLPTNLAAEFDRV